jgi:hypothetical protein
MDALVRALGLADGTFVQDGSDDDSGRDEMSGLRREVLERLARHEITADEAATLIRSRKE